jgi:hypothetical protein
MSKRFRPEVAGPMAGSAISGANLTAGNPACRCAHAGYSLCLTKCGMGRPPKPGTIRPLARRGKKSVVAYLPVPKWKELHIIAVLNETSIDALVHHGVDLVIEEYKKKRSP